MNTRDLERLLVRYSGYQPGEIDQRTRPLREHSLIPSGPRGVNAPDLEPLHAALVVLTMVSRRANEGGSTAMRAMNLKLAPRAGCRLDSMDLATMLAGGLTMGSAFLQRLEIACDGSMAWATIIEGRKTFRIFFTDEIRVARALKDDPSIYDATGGTYAGHWFIITGAIIDQILIEMKKTEPRPASYAKKSKVRA
jgi:hypothetical protein